MRWGQIQDDKGRRAVCMHEETIYELPAKLSPLLQFYSRYRTNFGDPANAVSILRENGATTLGHGEELWNTLPLCRAQLPRSRRRNGTRNPKISHHLHEISKRAHRPQRRNSDAFCKRNRKHKNRLGGRTLPCYWAKDAPGRRRRSARWTAGVHHSQRCFGARLAGTHQRMVPG